MRNNPKVFKATSAFYNSTAMNQLDKTHVKSKKKLRKNKSAMNQLDKTHVKSKKKLRKKKSGQIDKNRIVVRNLSPQVTEDELKKFLEKYGKIKEVNILRWDSGRPKGVAFIQYQDKLSAQNAIENCNMMTFLGQPIAVDLAVPQSLYKKEEQKAENEPEDFSEDEDEPPLLVPIDEPPRKKLAVQSQMKKEKEQSRPASADVLEGRALFLRNISYEATKEEVTALLNRFAPVDNLFFCMDKSTGKFKGTAFAHFQTKENAVKCLEASMDPMNKSDFTIDNCKIHIFHALPRGEVPKKSQHNKDPLDKRNIYLAREGVVREGTSAAEGVSTTDMRIRMQREIVKRRMLTNLSIFVSPFRLFVSNLPPSLTDAQLLEIFKKHSSQDATITESKIMKNLNQLDKYGNAVSKGYGFVTFTQHPHAIEALRAVNNNPEIFTRNKRPIVEFSLENREAVMTKFRRMTKSREKNKNAPQLMKPDLVCKTPASEEERKSFMGSSSNPNKKGIQALHSHIGPKVRHKDKDDSKTKKLSRNKLNTQLRAMMKRKRARTRGGKKAQALSKKKKEKAKRSNVKKNKKLTFLS